MCVNKQKKLADKILDKLFLIDPYSIVAGGAPRDWHFGEMATDIDVFFCVGRTATRGTVEQMLSRFLPEPDSFVSEDDLPVSYEKNSALRCVRSYTVEETSVQLIELHTPSFDIVGTFPVNMSKAWYKNGRITLERDFMIGEKTKLLYLTNPLYAKADKYVKKITEKFVVGKGYSWCQTREFAEERLIKEALGYNNTGVKEKTNE